MNQEIVEFIKNQFKSTGFIPLHSPIFNGNEKKYLSETIDSTFVSSVGKFVDKFEGKVAEYCNSKYAIATVNGTAALHIALKCVGVAENHEVITQPLTFVATSNAISYLNAEPIFLDVDIETMGLSPIAVQKFLNQNGIIKSDGTYNKLSGKKISACVPMHTFGFPVRIDDLVKVCNEWNIPVIEDSAESLGSTYKEKSTGTFGCAGVFSFNGNKIITSGGGGIIVTDDEKIAKMARHLTTTAKRSHNYEYYHDMVGYNYRMPNLNAALALAQFENLENFIKKKRDLANRYYEFFQKIGVRFRVEPKNSYSNYWLMSIEFANKSKRDDFLNFSNEEKVMSRPIWKLMSNLPMFAHCKSDGLTNSKILESTIVNIPSSVSV
jgi:perosamine synthetase